MNLKWTLRFRLKSTDTDGSQLRAEIRELQKDCKIYRQKLAKVEVIIFKLSEYA